MKWLDDVLASVPAEFTVEASDLPDGYTKVAPLPDDLIPVIRAWSYAQGKVQELAKHGLDRSKKLYTDHVLGTELDEEAVIAELESEVLVIERWKRQAAALGGLLTAALWEQFPDTDEDGLGAMMTKDGWSVVSVLDDRPRISLITIPMP